ncbi:MAG TPA: hypothetical protein VMS17_28545 [Gemmataceae bacterium]|nr:hypothetical protein [Gemmataceae bacterium]
MKSASIRIRCTRCSARIKAARELLGRQCSCPRCGKPIVIRRAVPRDADPVLVLMAAEEPSRLAFAYRRGA